MAMLIALLSVSFVLTVVTVVLLSTVLSSGESSPPLREIPHPTGAPRFFAGDISLSVPPVHASGVPVEVLVLEIEKHVRLEREVAESFHLSPTPQTLHAQAARPLLH